MTSGQGGNNNQRNFNKDDSYKNLDRINFWIGNCDTKASFILAFIAVFLTIALTSSRMDGIFKQIFDLLKEFKLADYKAIFVILITLNLFAIVLLIVRGAIYLIDVLTAKIDPKELADPDTVTNSKIFFASIASKAFSVFKNELDTIREQDILDDIDSQVYINSKICTAKFKNFNQGVKCIKIAVVCFAAFIFLVFLFNVIYC